MPSSGVFNSKNGHSGDYSSYYCASVYLWSVYSDVLRCGTSERSFTTTDRRYTNGDWLHVTLSAGCRCRDIFQAGLWNEFGHLDSYISVGLLCLLSSRTLWGIFFFFFYETRTKRSQKSLHYTTWVREIVRVLFRTFFFFCNAPRPIENKSPFFSP